LVPRPSYYCKISHSAYWFYERELFQYLHKEGFLNTPKFDLIRFVWAARLWKDTKGQDLIEYALMAGFVAVAAGAIMPGVASQISVIFSKVSSALTAAGGAS
jgi:pilus assembly protein Flp/PilA